MIRRQFSSLSASIIGVFEGQPQIKNGAMSNATNALISSVLISSGCTGKKGETRLVITPEGEALALVGVGNQSAPLLGERIRNAVHDLQVIVNPTLEP